MARSVQWLTLFLIAAACQDRSEQDPQRMPDVATRTGSADLEDREPGVEFEAPRLIPAVRAQMGVIREPDGATEGNLTAFRNGVGTLINAMEADLNRVGVTDTGRWFVLSDSVSREFGGGAGRVATIPPDEARKAADRVEQLITMYEERMRAAAR
jgi:hypothetical protein